MIRVNGNDEEFRSESIEDLLRRLGVETRGIAVALNGEIVRRAAWSDTFVGDECSIEIVTAAAGG